MIVDSQVKKVMTIPIVHEEWLRYEGQGKPVYDTANATTRYCYPTYQIRMVRNSRGEEVVSMLTLYIDGSGMTVPIDLKDRITLWDDRVLPIISIQPYYNEKNVIDFLEVTL